MNCIPSLCRVDTNGAPPPDEVVAGALPAPPRNRQAAVEYLQAATMSDSALQRTFLRRRAADLILPRLRDPGERRTC